ncbi:MULTISPECIES: alpha-galactosidase [unclassified Spirosoma]|uniref:alpha-galactosidase n=1 Tax=unclassified Spirosoma TaxID=2621999 RepID=UPI000959AB05|nr:MULTISPECIES: alpha-galactosidase [unclassified Spirosoma]MBN8823240.1 alpha-galactosidase [Spirosoma sp.]OJW72611.1 MAG: alpha-galactosidase [Spirosoma sp. 48-14]
MKLAYFLLPFLLLVVLSVQAAPGDTHIIIETSQTALVIRIDKEQIPTLVHLGAKLRNTTEYAAIPANGKRGEDYTGIYNSVYTPAGGRNLLEPAIQVTHADGNPSLDLKYIRHETQSIADGVVLTKVYLKDPQYPFEVTLYYKAYQKEDVIEQWSSIRHTEKKSVVLHKYASANLYIPAQNYYLTHFHGDWANEMNPSKVLLTEGIKVLDSKLGTRADLFQPPSFLVSLNQPAEEDQGEVIAGTLAWSGNYQLAFEVDPLHNLRVIPGINPYASAYNLAPGVEFTTPAFLFTYSQQGKGGASRHLHRWARKHRIPQGEGNRLTLLNNWEATYFDFNEEKLSSLFKDGKKLGVDLFLLDDGWFGNKYPRNDDHAALGDWQENVKKLPHGLGYLVKEAENAGIKFGIWLEPEMVSPKSELYEKHPDWVIKLPNRSEYYFRNQLVLDLSNPKVQDFVYNLVNDLLTKNPTLGFIKWDCNAVIYNAYSATNLNQSNLYVDYVLGLYKVLDRLRAKYPTLPMMLCSGGGGRVDYGALKYFTEYWPSDNTDALERIFIQWNYSYFFPSIASCNHVTDWGKQPIKFRTDVAMMGKLGYDIVVSKLTDDELQFSQQALKTYERIKTTIWQGDLFRLASPYTNDVASSLYISEQQDRAVWFTYLVKNRYKAGSQAPIKLKGLRPDKLYKIQELNVYPGTRSAINTASPTYSGNYLMTIGFNPQVDTRRTSVVLELTEAN